MAFSEIGENFELLKKDVLSYVNTKIDYLQLRALKKITKLSSRLINVILLSVIFILFIVFASTGAAILIGNHLEDMSYGFFIVAGFYLLILIFILLFGRALLRKQILKIFSFSIIRVKKIKF